MNISDLTLAKKYAYSYFITEDKDLDKKEENLTKIASIVKKNKSIFINPIIDVETKILLLKKLIANEIKDASAIRFINVLIANRRVYLIDLIIEEFKKISIDSKGYVKVDAYGKHQMNDKEKIEFINMFKSNFGKIPMINFIEDKDIIGGYRFRWDDKMLDLTLNYRIEKLKKQLINE